MVNCRSFINNTTQNSVEPVKIELGESKKQLEKYIDEVKSAKDRIEALNKEKEEWKKERQFLCIL